MRGMLSLVALAVVLTLLWRVEPVLVVGVFVGLTVAALLGALFHYSPSVDPSRIR
jgi:uncharacterized membrane protein